MAGQAGGCGAAWAGGEGDALAGAGAGGVSQALQGRAADRRARADVSAGTGVRLCDAEERCGTGRDRPEVQPADGARTAAQGWAGAADRADDADSRGAGRCAEDVEVAGECDWNSRGCGRDVRKADVDFGRADVEVLDAADGPAGERDFGDAGAG